MKLPTMRFLIYLGLHVLPHSIGRNCCTSKAMLYYQSSNVHSTFLLDYTDIQVYNFSYQPLDLGSNVHYTYCSSVLICNYLCIFVDTDYLSNCCSTHYYSYCGNYYTFYFVVHYGMILHFFAGFGVGVAGVTDIYPSPIPWLS